MKYQLTLVYRRVDDKPINSKISIDIYHLPWGPYDTTDLRNTEDTHLLKNHCQLP